jgi:hypothetical protein
MDRVALDFRGDDQLPSLPPPKEITRQLDFADPDI